MGEVELLLVLARAALVKANRVGIVQVALAVAHHGQDQWFQDDDYDYLYPLYRVYDQVQFPDQQYQGIVHQVEGQARYLGSSDHWVGFDYTFHRGILSASLRPGHDGICYKNSGHNGDQVDVRANRDTLAENSSSIPDGPDTTYSTSEHTSKWALQYR